jgi:hypothetical protein
MGCSSGKAISGIESSFLMNFGTGGIAAFLPCGAISFWKASSVVIGGGGSRLPAPWHARDDRILHSSLTCSSRQILALEYNWFLAGRNDC